MSSVANLQSTAVVQELMAAVREIENFPVAGVRFRDISPILENSGLFDLALQAMVEGIDMSRVDAFVGIESRGFILGAALAVKYQKGFIPLRKAGKLPPPVFSESYSLEYGKATLELRDIAKTDEKPNVRVVLIDDVLATGGTLTAGLRLCERAGFRVHDIRVLIDLAALNTFRFAGQAIRAAIRY